MTTPKREWLETLRKRPGLSQAELAEHLGTDPKTPARWERGAQNMYLRHRPALAEALGVTLDELDELEAAYQASREARPPASALLVPDGVLNPDQLERLGRAVRKPSRADAEVVQSLATSLAEYRRMEDHIGSGPLLVAVTAQLDLVTSLVVDARGPMRPAVVDIAAQWAQFLAWLNTSAGRHGDARLWWDRAAEWATEAANTTLMANVLSFKGHIAWMNGEIGPTIGLSQAAQRDTDVFVSQRAYDAHQEARGHAMAGDMQAAERKLDDARRLAQLTMEHPNQKAPWSYYYSPALYTAECGLVHLHLSFHDRTHAGQAVASLTEGIAGFVDAKDSDWAAEWRYHLALAHMQNDDHTEACAVAGDALETAHKTGFDRLIIALQKLHQRMIDKFTGLPDVAEFGQILGSKGPLQ